MTKLKNQNSYNSETKIVTKLNVLICDKTQNSNCDKTQIVTKTDEISQGSFLRSRNVFLDKIKKKLTYLAMIVKKRL